MVTRTYMSGHNDFAQFETRNEAGEVEQWIRYVTIPDGDRLYAAGAPIEIDYVIYRFRRPGLFDRLFGRRSTPSSDTTRVVLETRLGQPSATG